MSGKTNGGDRAQLALLDAMVFFAVSMVICATVLSHAAPGADDPYHVAADPRPDECLAVYLESSLGQRLLLSPLDLELTGRESFSETLSIVSALIVQGVPTVVFDPILTLGSALLAGLCAPYSALLSVSLIDGDIQSTVIELGKRPVGYTDAHSASRNLGTCEGAPLVATLVLFPAFPPEGVPV